MSRILLTGDTHGELSIQRILDIDYLMEHDFVIVCGDFGLLWDGSNNEKLLIEALSKKKFTTLFIDGNHENFHMLNALPIETWNGGKVHKIKNNIIHLMRGQVFTLSGRKIFTFGGAMSIDKMYRVEGVSWWKEELPSASEKEEGIYNLGLVDFKVDYILTHTCRHETLMVLSKLYGFSPEKDATNKYLDMIYEKTEFKHWFFGHFHKNLNYVMERETVIYENFKELE